MTGAFIGQLILWLIFIVIVVFIMVAVIFMLVMTDLFSTSRLLVLMVQHSLHFVTSGL